VLNRFDPPELDKEAVDLKKKKKAGFVTKKKVEEDDRVKRKRKARLSLLKRTAALIDYGINSPLFKHMDKPLLFVQVIFPLGL